MLFWDRKMEKNIRIKLFTQQNYFLNIHVNTKIIRIIISRRFYGFKSIKTIYLNFKNIKNNKFNLYNNNII